MRHGLVLAGILFFFNDTATTEIYTLSLHDALPISVARRANRRVAASLSEPLERRVLRARPGADRKSTRLNSSHSQISYAVFCLKKKTAPQGSANPPPSPHGIDAGFRISSPTRRRVR